MRNIFVATFLLCSYLGIPTTAHADDRQSAEEHVAWLDSESRARLGVGLLALSLLGDAGPGRFFPKQMLVDNGDWEAYRDLETAGFVVLDESLGLPDGSAAGVEFVSIELTPTGQKLKDAMSGP